MAYLFYLVFQKESTMVVLLIIIITTKKEKEIAIESQIKTQSPNINIKIEKQ